MIIQCKQCRTKFRFNGAQMEGDGLWMRCSRCQHVFFQDNPKISTSVVTPQASPALSQDTLPGKTADRLTFEPAGPALGPTTSEEEVTSFLRDFRTAEEKAEDEWQQESKPEKRAGISLTDIEFSPATENLDAMGEPREVSEETPAPAARKKGRPWVFVLWSVFIILVIPAIIIFGVLPQLGFPQYGERYIQIARKYVGLSQPTDGQFVTGQVKLQDIRQRVINNYVLGNIRIVEGIAVNQADFSIARILVKSETLDAYAVVLGERTSYAGNVLSDEELTNLSEEEIFKRLSLPEGRDNSNEHVISNGRIPFMIVFTRDFPGAIKTTVTISGAERLL